MHVYRSVCLCQFAHKDVHEALHRIQHTCVCVTACSIVSIWPGCSHCQYGTLPEILYTSNARTYVCTYTSAHIDHRVHFLKSYTHLMLVHMYTHKYSCGNSYKAHHTGVHTRAMLCTTQFEMWGNATCTVHTDAGSNLESSTVGQDRQAVWPTNHRSLVW